MPARPIASLSLALAIAALTCTPAAARTASPSLFADAVPGTAAGTPSTAAVGAGPGHPVAPMVDLVSPLVLDVGDVVTISGENFAPGPLRNQLVFVRPGIRPVFVPVELAKADEIRLHVPAKLLSYLRRENGKPVPTRFRITVLSSLFGPVLTPTRLSPLIKPPPAGRQVPGANDCDGDGVADTPAPQAIGLAVVGLGLKGVPALEDVLPNHPDVIGAPGVPDLALPDDLPPQSTPSVPEAPVAPPPGPPAPLPPPTGGCPAH